MFLAVAVALVLGALMFNLNRVHITLAEYKQQTASLASKSTRVDKLLEAHETKQQEVRELSSTLANLTSLVNAAVAGLSRQMNAIESQQNGVKGLAKPVKGLTKRTSPPAKPVKGPTKQTSPGPVLLVFVYSHFHDPRATSNLELLLRHIKTASVDTRVSVLITVPDNGDHARRVLGDKYRGQDVNLHLNAPSNHQAAFVDAINRHPSINQYKTFVLIRSTMRGPYVRAGHEDGWLDNFISKLSEEVPVAGLTVSCGQSDSVENIDKVHLQAPFLVMNKVGLELLQGVAKSYVNTQDVVVSLQTLQVGFSQAMAKAGKRFFCPCIWK